MRGIQLPSRKYPGLVTLVDDDVYEWASRLSLGVQRHGRAFYVMVRRGGRPTMLHGRILGYDGGPEIDHINLDGLDNRRCNLRHATRSQNASNRRGWVNGGAITSEFKGVSWDAERRLWRATVTVAGRRVRNRFRSERAAAEWYDEQARLAHGEYARGNFF
jgi:hypothetical protein